MPQRFRCILLFGPPGVGKGTQGKILGCVPGFVHLATGDIFRSLDKKSDLGQQFLKYSSRGELVPDDLTMRIWQQHVAGMIDRKEYDPAKDLLVLDGMPRSIGQAKAIAPLIDVLGIVQLHTTSIDELIRRMKKRAREEGRHDDADEAVIRRRFDVYEKETAPVLAQYNHSLVHRIDALGTPAEVLLRVLEQVAPIQRALVK